MSEFKGTPGPWEVEANTYYFSIESQGGGIGDVCMSGHVFDGGDCLGSTSKANASLIAAAPELLEALLDLRFKLYGSGNASPKIEHVIKKALGQ